MTETTAESRKKKAKWCAGIGLILLLASAGIYMWVAKNFLATETIDMWNVYVFRPLLLLGSALVGCAVYLSKQGKKRRILLGTAVAIATAIVSFVIIVFITVMTITGITIPA